MVHSKSSGFGSHCPSSWQVIVTSPSMLRLHESVTSAPGAWLNVEFFKSNEVLLNSSHPTEKKNQKLYMRELESASYNNINYNNMMMIMM